MELEDTQRQSLYLHKYSVEELKHRIGKKPRFLNEKLDGPDVYSIVGTLANELNDIPITIENRIEAEKFFCESGHGQI